MQVDVSNTNHKKMNLVIINHASGMSNHGIKVKAFCKMLEFLEMIGIETSASRLNGSFTEHSCLNGHGNFVLVFFGNKIGTDVIDNGDLKSLPDQRISNQALAKVA